MNWKSWLGLAVSAIFIYLFLRKIDPEEVLRSLKSVRYSYLLAAILMQFFVLFVRTERWRYLLKPVKKVMLYPLFQVNVMGFMANFLLPARIGELVRAYLVGDREQISKSTSLATVVLERVLDGFGVVFCLGLVLFFFPFPEDFQQNPWFSPYSLRITGTIFLIIYLIIISFLVLIRNNLNWVLRFLEDKLKHSASHWREKILDIFISFSHGLESLKKGWELIWVALLSIIIWVLASSVIYVAYFAFGIKLSFFSAILVEVLIALAVTLPSSPAFVGPFHYACAGGVALLGVEPNLAKSFAIILHLALVVPTIALGMFYMVQGGISFSKLRHME